jgi:hypothetical protein
MNYLWFDRDDCNDMGRSAIDTPSRNANRASNKVTLQALLRHKTQQQTSNNLGGSSVSSFQIYLACGFIRKQ